MISVGECVRVEKASLGFYLKEQEQLLIEVVIESVIPDNEIPKNVKVLLLQQRKLYSEKEYTLPLWQVLKK